MCVSLNSVYPLRGLEEFISWMSLITICSAVVVNKEETVAPFVTTWGYSTALWSILRNRAAYSFGSSKYVVIEYLLPQSIVVMMDKIPNSTNMVF